MDKVYECNPDKNRSCSKTGCIFNIDARYKVCHQTANKKYEWFPEFDKARQVKHRTREDINELKQN